MDLINNFPSNIKYKINKFDNTYYNYFNKYIIPFINKKWMIISKDKITNFIYMDISILSVYFPKINLIANKNFTYKESIKICNLINKNNDNYFFYPFQTN